MEREEDLDVVARRQLGERGADRLEGRAEALPAMGGDQHLAALVDARRQRRFDGRGQRRFPAEPAEHQVERIDAAVAGDEDLAVQPLRGEIVARRAGRREMEIGDQGDGAAIIFLGIRLGLAPGAQPRLDMGDRDPAVEGGERCGHGGGGVALDDDPVRRRPDQHRIEPLDEPRHERIERLLRRHDLKVEIGMKREEIEDRASQIAMLAGHANMRLHTAFGLKSPQQGSKLDGFRARAENRQKLHDSLPPFSREE